jgi:HEAT repeat protein
VRRLLIALVLLSFVGCGKAPPTTRVNHWIETLRSPDAKLRKKAAFTLGNLGTTDPAVVPALRGALSDTDSAVRREAILALVKCGPLAGDAIPTLTQMQRRDPDARVRQCAAKAVEKLQKEG